MTWRGLDWPGKAGSGVVWQGRRGRVGYDTTGRGWVRCGLVWLGSVRQVWRGRHGWVWHGAVGQGVAWQARRGLVRHGRARLGKAWYGKAGKEWNDLVGRDLARPGME